MKSSKAPSRLAAAEVRMQEAQALGVQVEADTAALRRLLAALPAMQRRQQALARYVQTQWLADAELLQSDPEADRRLLEAAPPGHCSALGEDTLWDALTGAQLAVQQGIKALARRL